MEPTYLPRIPVNNAPYPLENIEYIPFEMFTNVINYDYTINDNYYISTLGRLYSIRYKRLISQYLDEGGYYRVNITIAPGKTLFTGVHKIMMMSFHPIVETDLFVPNHKNGIKTDNVLSNLEWVTISINTRHALDTGLSNCKCENNSRSYLSNDTIHFICSKLEQDYTISEILDMLNYPYGEERNRVAAIIRHIRSGQTYLDISSQYNIAGIKGQKFYPPEMTKIVCDHINNRLIRIDQLCNELKIPLEDRKMFKNYVQSIVKGRCDTHISKRYNNLKNPLNVPRDYPFYDYYN